MKRICLFAGYDPQNKVDDYVVFYVQKLAEIADVFYLADSDMPASELKKLSPFTKKAFAKRHGRYDFGSWSLLVQKLGWEKLEEYDEVLFVNDSCYAPLFDLKPIFDKMESEHLDAWGLAANHFMMSFFLAFDKKIIKNPRFRHFIESIEKEKDKNIIIRKYEKGLDTFLKDEGYKTGAYFTPKKLEEFYKKNKGKIKKDLKEILPFRERIFMRFRPNKIRLYGNDCFLNLAYGFPLLKKLAISSNPDLFSKNYLKFLNKYSKYDSRLIQAHLKRLHPDRGDITLSQILKRRFLNFLNGFLIEKKYKKNYYIIRFLKIPIYKKKMDYSIK